MSASILYDQPANKRLHEPLVLVDEEPSRKRLRVSSSSSSEDVALPGASPDPETPSSIEPLSHPTLRPAPAAPELATTAVPSSPTVTHPEFIKDIPAAEKIAAAAAIEEEEEEEDLESLLGPSQQRLRTAPAEFRMFLPPYVPRGIPPVVLQAPHLPEAALAIVPYVPPTAILPAAPQPPPHSPASVRFKCGGAASEPEEYMVDAALPFLTPPVAMSQLSQPSQPFGSQLPDAVEEMEMDE